MLISIIIATWNASKTIERCIDSIVPQLTDEVELIIIDGGSTDNTNEIISTYDKVTYTISEKDRGIYDAWNKGIRVATGKWVAFVGADDILLPNSLKQYFEIISNTFNIDSYDYICAQNEYIDKKGKLIKTIGDEPKWAVFRKRMNVAHVASLHNKSNLFESIGFFDIERYHICADYELLLRKKDRLKSLFIQNHIAQMEVGGMSFSINAIIETFRIRRHHNSVGTLSNYFYFIRDLLAYYFFIFRKTLLGAKL